MRPRLHVVVAAAAAVVLLPGLTVSAAYAAAPSNDTPSGATVISALPTVIDEDTTAATTDAGDAALNAECGAPETGASVWFAYTDTTGTGFIASVEGSDYSAGLIVTEGDPALGIVVACGPGAVGVETTLGTTYYVMAFSDSTTTGGHLNVSFDAAPPPPELSVTANTRAVTYKDGSVLVSGTYSCAHADNEGSEIDGTLTQRVGRTKISGDFSVWPLECDGSTHPWSAQVVSYNGLFRGGKAASITFGYACGAFTCTDGYSEQTIQLSGGGKK